MFLGAEKDKASWIDGVSVREYVEDKSDEPLIKESPKPCRTKAVVTGVEIKVVRALPLLWGEWQYASIKEILYSDIKTCL